MAALVFCVLGLAACQRGYIRQSSPSLPYKVDGASDRAVVGLEQQMAARHLEVITLGEQHMVAIPANLLFATQSPKLTWESYDLLNLVVCYLKQFRKIEITVASHTSPCIAAKRDQALSLARARTVADYLVSQNVDSRLVITKGLGSDKPILRKACTGDKSLNSRLEILFKEAII